MRRLRKLITVLLLGLWMPATSHVLLEQAGIIHQDEHEDENPASGTANDHDAADGICLILSKDVRAPQPVLTGLPLPQIWVNYSVIFTALLEVSLTSAKGPDPPGVAPAELSTTWQFSYRASLPPRAPSLIF